MNTNYVAMGEYYHSENGSLIKTIGRFFDYKTNDPMIGYVYVKNGSYVSDAYVMPEIEFKEIYSL